MRCTKCRSELKVTVTTHLYVESGLPDVVLHGVEVRKCRACGEEEVAIPNLAGLHRCIAANLVARKSALTGAELKFLRQFLGHASKDFAKMLGVAPETVSRWENAQRDIPPAVDRLVRVFVMHTAPRTDYSAELFAAIRPDPPKRPRLSLRHRGNVWGTNKAA
jgi:putative zinc finger/helix-turn-helix YgiT family protein